MNVLWRSIIELWRGLSPGQKLSILGMSILTAAILGGLVWWSQKPEMSLLYASLDPAEAGKISDELRDQKVPYEISQGGRSIYVPRSMVYDLRLQLATKGIPRGGTGGGGVGFELFDKPSFGLSDFLQKANYYRALQGELARTISQIREVESARVLIVVPNDRLFSAEKSEAKASVFLQLRGNQTLGKEQVNAIRFLVANGVERLDPNRVVIADNNGTLHAENEEKSGAGMTGTQLEVRRGVERMYSDKIQTMLDQVLGFGQSVVRVSVDMNFDNVQQTEEKFDPNASVVRTESVVTEETQTPVSGAGGATGTAGNLANASNVTAQASVEMANSKKSTSSNAYEISKTVLSTVKGVGDIQKVSVAVMVNSVVAAPAAPGGAGDTAAPATSEAKPLTEEDRQKRLTQIEGIIKAAMGYTQEGKGRRNDEVKIEEMAFVAQPGPDLTGESDLAGKAAEKMDRYLYWAGQGVLVIIALGLFLFFRSLLIKSRSEQLKSDLSLEDILSAEKKAQLENVAPKPVTVSEISKLIKDNPANMATSLKNWMNQAS